MNAKKAAIENAKLVYEFCLSKVPELCKPDGQAESPEKADI
jgi:hypothetical protein